MLPYLAGQEFPITPPPVNPVGVMALADHIVKLLVRSDRKASGIGEWSGTFMTLGQQLSDIANKRHGANRHDSSCTYSLEIGAHCGQPALGRSFDQHKRNAVLHSCLIRILSDLPLSGCVSSFMKRHRVVKINCCKPG